MTNFSHYYRTLIEDLPAGLDRALLRALSSHLGRSNCITRDQLIRSLYPYEIHERQLRQQIRLLRRQGYLIGSAPGENGGYYLITSPQEFQSFLQEQYVAIIADMSETASAMRKSAEQIFDPIELRQPALFD
jgi:predicted DNA-binding transcriptional regulator YafY